MKDLVELLVILLGGSEGIILFWVIGTLSGWLDEIWRAKGDWNDVLYLSFVFSLSAVVIQLLVIGILWIERNLGLSVPSHFQNPLYIWGFRLVALVALLRVIWPRRRWSENSPVPSYARLKLFGLALLAGALSFLPIA